jgi:hypothetical protein
VNANNAADGVTSITATAPLTGGTITSTGSIGLDQTALSITRSQVSDFTSGTVTSASTAQQSGTAVYAVNSGTAVYATTSGTAVSISGSITKSQVSDFTSGTVASAGTAQQAGTAVFANNSGTATYATTSGTAVFATNASTAVSVSGSAITQSQVVNLTTDLANRAVLNAANAFTAGGHTITNAATAVIPLTIIGASGQSANLQNWTNGGVTQASISAFGAATFATGGTVYGRLSVNTGTTATVGAVIRGAAGQSANLQEWQNSGGTARGYVTPLGDASFGSLGLGYTTPYSGVSNSILGIVTAGTANIGIAVRGAASQSADLLQIQNSGGTAIASISSAGALSVSSGLATISSGGIIRGAQVSTNGDLATMREENSGGLLRLTKQTAAAANSASGQAKIYLRDGTDAGTLKLVVRAGTAGAETTILDNIPQT